MSVGVERWRSCASPNKIGMEAAAPPLVASEIRSVLDRMNIGAAGQPSFVLVKIATTDAEGFAAAFRAAGLFDSPSRICLAVNESTLQLVDLDTLADHQPDVGIVLDEVDVATPMSLLIRDGVEAVRYSSSFVEDATRSLRVRAALNASLGLARELGIVTFGQGSQGELLDAEDATLFDYVLMQSRFS